MTRTQIRDTVQVLKAFARHPLEEIARLPDWSLRHLILLQLFFAVISGVLTHLWNPSFWKLLQSFTIFPVFALIMNMLLAAFFYYFFQIFENRTVSFVRLFHLVLFASLPFFLFHVASGLIILADLLGFAMTAILLVIGLTENFRLEKRRSLRLIAVIFFLLFLLWLFEKVTSSVLDNTATDPRIELRY